MKEKTSNFPVKQCPDCGSAWERVGKGNVHYGTDWPMISKLEKEVCKTCSQVAA